MLEVRSTPQFPQLVRILLDENHRATLPCLKLANRPQSMVIPIDRHLGSNLALLLWFLADFDRLPVQCEPVFLAVCFQPLSASKTHLRE